MILEIKKQEKQTNAAWREHNRIVRGNPVRVYEGEKFVLKRPNTAVLAEGEDASGDYICMRRNK